MFSSCTEIEAHSCVASLPPGDKPTCCFTKMDNWEWKHGKEAESDSAGSELTLNGVIEEITDHRNVDAASV